MWVLWTGLWSSSLHDKCLYLLSHLLGPYWIYSLCFHTEVLLLLSLRPLSFVLEQCSKVFTYSLHIFWLSLLMSEYSNSFILSFILDVFSFTWCTLLVKLSIELFLFNYVFFMFKVSKFCFSATIYLYWIYFICIEFLISFSSLLKFSLDSFRSLFASWFY